MPDATGLELIRQELGDSVLDTTYFRERATLVIDPASVRAVLAHLRAKGYSFLASVHGVDYYPEEPRLGVVYELLDMQKVDRITVKLRRLVQARPEAGWRERYDAVGTEEVLPGA